MFRTFSMACVCAILLLVSSTAHAEGRHSIVWQDATVIRYNPIGLISAATLEYRLRLYEAEHPALEQNYLSFAAIPTITPAFTRIGARVELMPLTLLRLGVQYETIQYFDTFGYLQSFDSPTADVSEAAKDAGEEDGETYDGGGTQLSFTALLQAKVGPIAVRTKLLLGKNDYLLEGDDTVFFDSFLDILAPRDGWIWTNDLDVLYMADPLIAGLRYSVVGSILPGIERDADPNGPVHRLGPLILYKVGGDGVGKLTKVSLLGLFQIYLAHRYRTGQEISRALPYMGVGVLLEGDLF